MPTSADVGDPDKTGPRDLLQFFDRAAGLARHPSNVERVGARQVPKHAYLH
jgi:hypothetical protein